MKALLPLVTLSLLVLAAPVRAEELLWGEMATTLGKGFLNVTTSGNFRSSKPYRHHGGAVTLTIDRMDAGALVEYGLRKDLDLRVRLPYFSQTIEERFAGDSVDHPMAGLGEMRLGTKWRFRQSINQQHKDELALLADLKLPTGKTDLRDRNGLIIEPHLQPNSGNLGVLLGVAANRMTPRVGYWLSSRVGAETAASRYHRGMSLELHGSAGYRLRPLTQLNRIDWMSIVGMHFHMMGKEREAGRTLRDSGGSVTSVEVSLIGERRHQTAAFGIMLPIRTDLGLSDAPPRLEVQGSLRASF